MPGADEFDVDPEGMAQAVLGRRASPGPRPKEKPKGNGADGSGWGEPYMGVLRLRRRPPPALPLEVFGETWKQWILDAASAAACPVDYVVAPLLASVSTLIGNARWAQAWPGWGEPPHLWCVAVGDSGTGKSPGADCLMRDVLPEIERRMFGDIPIVCANGRLPSNSTNSPRNAGRMSFAKRRKRRSRYRRCPNPRRGHRAGKAAPASA